jgi:hypothetical protein
MPKGSPKEAQRKPKDSQREKVTPYGEALKVVPEAGAIQLCVLAL